MAVSTEEVRNLADFEAPEGFYVTSFYLNVNAEEFPDSDHVTKSFNSAIHDAELQRSEIEKDLSHDATESLRNDFGKLREMFEDESLDRTDTNGIAVFSCSAADFWEVVNLSTPVESAAYFGRRPYVAPIATFLSHTKPTAVLVTDKQHARIFTMKNGEIREWTDFEDFVPQRTSQGGWSQNRYQRRSDKWANHHLDKAAELTLRLLQNYPFDWLIIGTEVQYENELLGSLHPYVKDRLVGQIRVRIDVDAAEIVQEAQAKREEVETEHINNLMHQVQEYAGADGRGTIGLRETLRGLNEQKVHILLLQEGVHAPGAVCTNCGFLTLDQPETCEVCGEPTRQVENIYNEMIQRALELGSIVEVATEFEQLKPIENIGSIMYY